MVNLIWHIHHAAEPVERNQIEHFFFSDVALPELFQVVGRFVYFGTACY